jgi:hypothetical protein
LIQNVLLRFDCLGTVCPSHQEKELALIVVETVEQELYTVHPVLFAAFAVPLLLLTRVHP